MMITECDIDNDGATLTMTANMTVMMRIRMMMTMMMIEMMTRSGRRENSGCVYAVLGCFEHGC